MKKTTLIIVIAILVIAAVIGALLFVKPTAKSNLNITSAQDLTTLIDSIYKGVTIEMPGVMSNEVDVTDAEMVKFTTGLENGNELEHLVVSEPMMSSQAYSLVLAKVKSGSNASKIAETMKDNIDTRKWICVTAEKVYATSSGDVVFLVMTRTDLADAVYNSFKTLAGSVGTEFERTEQI